MSVNILNWSVYDLEEWRDIEGYEGLYKISSHGRVMSLHYRKSKAETNKIMKICNDSNGYKTILLCRGRNDHKHHRINRLVASAFIPNPNNYPVVNHIDENPANNHVSNLEWCTISYNTSYGLSPFKRTLSRGRRVAQLDLYGNIINTYPSGRFAAKQLGLANTNLFSVLNGKQKTFGGYKWKYIDD